MSEALIQAAGLQVDKPVFMRMHGGRRLQFHALMYIIRGEGYFEDERTPRCTVRPGCFFYLHPGRWHNFDPYDGGTWTEYWVLFDGKLAKRRFGLLIPDHPALYKGLVEPGLVQTYEQLYSLWFFRPIGHAEYLPFLLHRLLAEFHLRAQGIEFKAHGDVVDRAKHAMHERLADKDFDIRAYVRKEGLSYESFRKRFKKDTGFAPNQYFLMLKLNTAKERLVRGGGSVKEVAFAMGFKDPYYFSRLFHAKFGRPPGYFKRRPLA